MTVARGPANQRAKLNEPPMSDPKSARPKARLPRGFGDREAADMLGVERMCAKIREVYERYGFDPVETPFVEFTDALGKFLPDRDRPNEGVFSFQDDDEQWLSLRYDLTAPLARYVAENFERLPKPYRSYRAGWVFRNEKPGPGRFRQFMQFDADTVGAGSAAADAEICMMAADTMEALGIRRGDYVIKVNNRKVLDGVMEAIGLGGEENAGRRLTVMRAVDKLDRLGVDGVRQLLGPGRKDESGDFTKGAGLHEKESSRLLGFIDAVAAALGGPPDAGETLRDSITDAINRLDELGPQQLEEVLWENEERASGALLDDGQAQRVLDFLRARYVRAGEAEAGSRAPWSPTTYPSDAIAFSAWRDAVGGSAIGNAGIDELEAVARIVRAAGYGPGQVAFDSSIVRGLEYYTGPVFEAQLSFDVVNEEGRKVRFGSVGGGGRYDGLVSRFRGEAVPATGFSIGVSRLYDALKAIKSPIVVGAALAGPVVVLVMDKDRVADYQRIATSLRNAGIRAEMYLGSAGMKPQMKYADRRGAPCVIIQGSNEKAAGEVQIKDLIEGAKQAAAIGSHADYKAARPAQFSVKDSEAEIVAAVRKLLAEHGIG
jgi:histidyl-tRNA synthetase